MMMKDGEKGVTLRELQELYYLDELIRTQQERLETLRESADVHSPMLSDMPKAPGARDKIGDIVPLIADEEAQLNESIRSAAELRRRLTAYIDTLPNVRIRLIMIKRFIQQKTWQQVAAEIGGKETEYSVKNACYRYIKDREDPPWLKNQVSFFEGGDQL